MDRLDQPDHTGFGAEVAASDLSGRTVACHQHIMPESICIVGPLLAETRPAFSAITGLSLYGREIVVVGFGPVGQGVALRARDLGANVTVVDLDPLRLIQAQHHDCRVADVDEAVRRASVVVTATGFDGVVGAAQIECLPDGAILLNVGHSNREIDVDWLNQHPHADLRRHLERYEVNGRRVHLLNRGSLVNLAAGLGIAAPQLFDPFAAIMLLGLDAILTEDFRFRLRLSHLSAPVMSVLLLVMTDEVEALRTQFVVEVGVRQAWPFLTLCDNAHEPPLETRLYIGTAFRVGASPLTFAEGDPDPAVATLLELNNRTVTAVAVGADKELRLVFDDGQSTLVVDAVPSDFTGGDLWWLAPGRF